MRRLDIVLSLAAAATLATGLGWIVLATPIEAAMGPVQKIFYFHVPAAYAMYLSWVLCAGFSVAWIVRRDDRHDALAAAASEVALLFATMVMITGPLWGRKSWGAYWAWDPRLTTALLLTVIILAHVALRGLGRGPAERRFAAALAILGACLVPLVHLSVHRWRGQHPQVITGAGGGLAAGMVTPFVLGLVGFTLAMAALIRVRAGLELAKGRLAELEDRAVRFTGKDER